MSIEIDEDEEIVDVATIDEELPALLNIALDADVEER